ncbi:MAG: phage terminase large subunit [Acetobacteraceae bacterium]
MPCDSRRVDGRALPDLDGFAELVLGADGLKPARHHRLLLSRLTDLAEGNIDRLMVMMPPGSAKSTYCSVLFPVWFLGRYPGSSIIAAAHTADLADHFARQARALIAEQRPVLGYHLNRDERAVARWSTSNRGRYFATGVRGPIAGRRADLAIIDDPVRSLADADSARARSRLWDWYCADLITRLKPGGRVMLVMTRWHLEDLAGRLLERAPDEWTQLRLPALAEADDPLGREPGAALWPEWEDERALLRKRDQVGERMWQALYQQSPQAAGGTRFKVARIAVLDELPSGPGGKMVRAWDLAATPETGSNDPDWTAGVKLLWDRDGRFIVMDVIRQRTTPLEVEQTLLAVAVADGRGVTICLAEDPGQAGKAQADAYVRKLSGFAIRRSRETGSKLSRSTPVAAQIEAGNLAIMRAGWNRAFLDELSEFPHGRKDDQVDALSRAFIEIVDIPAQAYRLESSFLAR